MAERVQGRAPALEIRGLNVYYGASHALQGVDLRLGGGVLSVVGRNGMGKTTLCKAIMGLVPVASGSITFAGQSLVGRGPAEIARMGIGYVPQGRRLWRSLTVNEHLEMVAAKGGAWSVERVYSTFPRLAERKSNGGAQLSGGEQQMLAIGRALLTNPKLLVMDEPTEGLAPVIVAQVEEMLLGLGEAGEMDVLVIEQNIGVACAVADDVAIMVNGRIDRIAPARELAGDRDLQQRLLGVGRHAHDDTPAPTAAQGRPEQDGSAQGGQAQEPKPSPAVTKIYVSNPTMPTRWSAPTPVAQLERAARGGDGGADLGGAEDGGDHPPIRRRRDRGAGGGHARHQGRRAALHARHHPRGRAPGAHGRPVDQRARIRAPRSPRKLISGLPNPRARGGRLHRRPGASPSPAMTLAFERWIAGGGRAIAGIVSAGGSGGTAMVAPAMRAPADRRATSSSSRRSRQGEVSHILSAPPTIMDAALGRRRAGPQRHHRGGARHMRPTPSSAWCKARPRRAPRKAGKPAVALSMFGVTTPCVQQVVALLECGPRCALVFHATGIGGRSMEKLIDGPQGRGGDRHHHGPRSAT